MTTQNNNYVGTPVDVNRLWSKASDLYWENPTSIPNLEASFSYRDLSFETPETEDNAENTIQYIQECLSEIMEGIPKVHKHPGGNWVFSSPSMSKKAEGYSSLSYFGIPINENTGFTNSDSLLKFVSSQTSGSTREPPVSPVYKRKSPSQENIDPHQKKTCRIRGPETSLLNIQKAADPEILRWTRPFQNPRLDGCGHLQNDQYAYQCSTPKLSPTRPMSNNRIVVFADEPAMENQNKKVADQDNLLKNVLKSNALGLMKENLASGQKVGDNVLNSSVDVFNEWSMLPNQGSLTESVLDCLNSSENNSTINSSLSINAADLPTVLNTVDDKLSKPVLEHTEPQENSDLEFFYETVKDVELNASFQNLSMNEEDVEGKYIILDETTGSFDEIKVLKDIVEHQAENNFNKQDIVEKSVKKEEIDIPTEKEHQTERHENRSVEEEVVGKEVRKEAISVQKVEVAKVLHETQKKKSTDNVIISGSEIAGPSRATEERELPEPEIKAYMLPFVSDDPEENKDNEDPRWDYMKKLETDEERYQLCRKLWKSLIVPDPNVNLTYFGYLRYPNKKNASDHKSGQGKTTKKRQREPEDEQPGPPKKKSRGIVSLNFTCKEIEKQRNAVTRDFHEELPRTYGYSRSRLEKAYYEKMEQLHLAKTEILTRHKFYKGLPDQNLDICQDDVEREFKDLERHYERYKTIYNWHERALFI